MFARRDLLLQTFRANPEYDLVPFRRLGPGDRALADDLSRDPDNYGILRPRSFTTLGVKAVSNSVAALVRALATPRALPDRLRAASDDASVDEILRLVLDGVVQVEGDRGFVCGAGGDFLFDAPDGDTHAASDCIMRMSLDALRHASWLRIQNVSALSARLYFFNRAPVTPRWANRLPNPSATRDWLGLTRTGATRALLERHWEFVPSNEPGGWLSWVPRESQPAKMRESPTYKLYVSPACAHVRETFHAVVEELARFGPTSFKVGGDVQGLLRPDKIVLYFPAADALARCAEHLHRALDGTPAHGVPFTASVESTGLLSRGIDPPASAKVLSWRTSESWRLWTTNRLAVYMLTARATSNESTRVSAGSFARLRLALDGVDTRSWNPVATSWLSRSSMPA